MAHETSFTGPRQGIPQPENMADVSPSEETDEAGRVHLDKDELIRSATSVRTSVIRRMQLLGISYQDAEDAVQQVVVKLINKNLMNPDSAKFIQHMESFLFVAAKRKYLDAQRRAKKECSFPTELATLAYASHLEDKRDDEHKLSILETVREDLDPNAREIIKLRTEGLSFKHISVILRITEATARKRYQLAIERLRKMVTAFFD